MSTPSVNDSSIPDDMAKLRQAAVRASEPIRYAQRVSRRQMDKQIVASRNRWLKTDVVLDGGWTRVATKFIVTMFEIVLFIAVVGGGFVFFSDRTMQTITNIGFVAFAASASLFTTTWFIVGVSCFKRRTWIYTFACCGFALGCWALLPGILFR